jgi:hypothetical protein
VGPIFPRLRLIGRRREFAHSIRGYLRPLLVSHPLPDRTGPACICQGPAHELPTVPIVCLYLDNFPER